ncbi:MAG: glycosyltransferase family 4 protein [Anaerolineae bacterium]
MKVLHVLGQVGRLVHDPDRHALAGIGNAAIHIAAAQQARGYQVSVCGFSDPLPSGKGTWQGLEIVAMHRYKWARLSSRLDVSFLLPVFFQVMRRSPLDVLHAHELGLLYLPLARLRIVHLHIPLGEQMGKSPLWKRADAVICCSQYVREKFLAACDYSADRTFVVYNGAVAAPVDRSEVTLSRQMLGVSSDEIVVLFVGALVAKKGPHILLAAIRDLMATQPDYRARIRTLIVGGSRLWRMRGNESEADNYERELQSVGQETGTAFLGLLPLHEVRRLQQACDIVVVPSIFQEPHPLVVCEAMAAGKPVVASRVGGIPETVIDGQTGILFPEGDHWALALALRHLIENPDLRCQMGNAARERAKLFSWDAAADRLDQIYHSLLYKGLRS